jgi:hypothetical protein
MVRHMTAMSTVDALKWVQSRAQQFFGHDRPDAVHLLAYLMADVLELGKGECVIRVLGEWSVIGSDVKWLVHEKYALRELFSHVVPAPAHGEHSMRGEILLSAFASDVAVLDDGQVLTIQGRPPPMSIVEQAKDMAQALLFRLVSAPDG